MAKASKMNKKIDNAVKAKSSKMMKPSSGGKSPPPFAKKSKKGY